MLAEVGLRSSVCAGYAFTKAGRVKWTEETNVHSNELASGSTLHAAAEMGISNGGGKYVAVIHVQQQLYMVS